MLNLFSTLGAIQEGIPSIPRAPLVLAKNRGSSPENPNIQIEDPIEVPEHEEFEGEVNGKLDINIKDNSINDKSDNNNIHTRYYQRNDFKHNYH